MSNLQDTQVTDIWSVAIQQIEAIRQVEFDPTLEYSYFDFESEVAKIRLRPNVGKLAFRDKLVTQPKASIYFGVDPAKPSYAVAGLTDGIIPEQIHQLWVSGCSGGAYVGCGEVKFFQSNVAVARMSYLDTFFKAASRRSNNRVSRVFIYNEPLFVERFLGTIAEFGVGRLAIYNLNHRRSWNRDSRKYRKRWAEAADCKGSRSQKI